jgi:hypothetical protein
MTTFNFMVDDGLVQTVDVKSGKYLYAAAAIPALFDLDLPCEITIWNEHKEFRFRAHHDEFGQFRTELLVPVTQRETTRD